MAYSPDFSSRSDYDEDGGFDFGDSYADLNVQDYFEPTSSQKDANGGSKGQEKADRRENGLNDKSTPMATSTEVKGQSNQPVANTGFFVGGSPKITQAPKEVPNVESANKPSSPGIFKKGRFSNNLPQNTSSSRRSGESGNMRSKYQRGGSQTEKRSHDPQEQSRMLEKGEELRVAVCRGNVERVKSILDSGFDPNMKQSGWPPLMHACDSGQEKSVELLLERGANPNTQQDQYTALMAVCANKTSRKESLVNCARLLINKGARVNTHDRHHMSPLLYACQNGHTSLVELLISANADVYKQDTRNWTALSFAANNGHLQTVQLLIKHNADPEALTYLGESPSNLALDGNHTEVADWLDSFISSREFGGHLVNGSSLPTHPLLEGHTTTGISDVGQALTDKPSSDGANQATPTSAESGSTMNYGKLELFLLGQQLGDLLPLFKKHKIEFSDLISMTEKDLEMMGVVQVGPRKKLLAGIVDIHKRQWDMPKTISLPYGRPISSAEASVILSNLTQHTKCIKGTVLYLHNQVTANPEMIDDHTETAEVDKLTNELAGTLEAVTSFQEEAESLEAEIRELLPDASTAKMRNKVTAGDVSNRKKKVVTFVKVASIVTIATVVSYVAFRHFSQK